jgi:hypothetical protein
MGMDKTFDALREQLKDYMGIHDLTVSDVAKKLNRQPLAIWSFLRKGTKPHFALEAKIKRLVGGKS